MAGTLLSLLCNRTDLSPLIPKCPMLYSKNGNFEAEEQGPTVLFKCLRNFHYVSGSKSRECLDDGQWSGEDFLCEVDYFMEKYKLSGCIVFTAFVLCLIFFGTDLYLYAMRRRRTRSESRRRICLYMQKFRNSSIAEIDWDGQDQRKLFLRILGPSSESRPRIKSLREYQSATSIPLSPRDSTYIETGPKDFWYLKSIFRLSPSVDVTNNQPWYLKSFHQDTQAANKIRPNYAESGSKGHHSQSKDDGRYHVPIVPDQPLQGIRLIKPTRKYDKLYKDEEVLGIGRPEIKKKKREKEEPEKTTKKRLLLAFSKERRNSEHVDLNERWTQSTVRKRSYRDANM